MQNWLLAVSPILHFPFIIAEESIKDVFKHLIDMLKRVGANDKAKRLQNTLNKFNAMVEATANDSEASTRKETNARIAEERRQKSVERSETTEKQAEGKTVNGERHSLTETQAISVIEAMKANAEVAPQLELTPENWAAEFGADGVVSTPIGDVKMGDGQYQKMQQQGRSTKLGMIKPTLINPDVIVEEVSTRKDGKETERNSSYVFVKAFTNAEGTRDYMFTSVSNLRDGIEIVMSNQEKETPRIKRLLKEGKLAYINKATLPSEFTASAQGDQSTIPSEVSYSKSKDTTTSPENQINGPKYSIITPEMDADYLAAEELAEIKAERKVIIKRAKADGTYLKAPNGKDTNLTPKQWVNVRTSRFKAWFGDWEKAARIAKLRDSKSVSITGGEITPNDNMKEYRKNALEYGKTLRGEYINADTGNTIVINKDSLTEVLHHDGSNVAHIQSIAAIPQMVESGIYITSEPIGENSSKKLRKAKMAHYYVCGLNIGGVPYTVKFVVAEFESGEKYYDHSLTEIEKGELLNRVEVSSTVAESKTPISDIKDKRLISILQTNSSKVVDANGEPKVVYHRTPKKFTEFDVSKIGSESGFGAFGNGFYFSPFEEQYRMYGKYKMPIFLNARNPFYLNEHNVYDTRASFGLSPEGKQRGWTRTVSKEFTQWLKDNGYDSVVYKTDYNEEEDVVFSPNQIKSATNNVGTYNPENDDIRYSLSEDAINGVMSDFRLTKDNEHDFSYALASIVTGTSRDYSLVGDMEVRIKGHTPNWDNFLDWETDEPKHPKILNVTVGDYNNTNFRRNKEDYESFVAEHPETIAVNVEIEDGTYLEDAIAQIHSALQEKGIDIEFASNYGWVDMYSEENNDLSNLKYSRRYSLRSMDEGIDMLKGAAEKYNIGLALMVAENAQEYVAMMQEMGVHNAQKKAKAFATYLRDEEMICFNGTHYLDADEVFIENALLHEFAHHATAQYWDDVISLVNALDAEDVL